MTLPSLPPPPSAAAKEATAKLRSAEDLLLDAAIDASLLPPDAPSMLASSKVHTNTFSSLVPLLHLQRSSASQPVSTLGNRPLDLQQPSASPPEPASASRPSVCHQCQCFYCVWQPSTKSLCMQTRSTRASTAKLQVPGRVKRKSHLLPQVISAQSLYPNFVPNFASNFLLI